MRLENKVALVTGAGQGIGRAIALTFAREGANVVINDVNLAAAEQVAEEINSLGRQALAIKADVSISEEVNQMVGGALDELKKIDILVNNAGLSGRIPIVEMPEDRWAEIIAVNLKGDFLCCQAVGKVMIKQECGKIVNIASVAAHESIPGASAYGPSKAGVLQLTRVLAVEWGPHNINVNAVSPGMTMTPKLRRFWDNDPQFYERYVKRMPLRRANDPQDIANAVLFLASSDADNITGQEICVDLGLCALHAGYIWPDE